MDERQASVQSCTKLDIFQVLFSFPWILLLFVTLIIWQTYPLVIICPSKTFNPQYLNIFDNFECFFVDTILHVCYRSKIDIRNILT